MFKKRAFIRYTKKGKLVPGSLIITTNAGYPVDGLYTEVPTNICCDTDIPGTITTSPKGWVRYTKKGTIVPGSLVVGKSHPKDGVWKEVLVDLCCITTTTTTIAPIIPAHRCSAHTGPFSFAYFAIEREWYQFPYEFQLVSMVLNGVEYASNETLTINSYGDLNFTNSLFNEPNYPQNINEWLNSIPGVSDAGFVFYDNMQTIDMPASDSTYVINIRRTQGQAPTPLDYFIFKSPTAIGLEFPTYTGTAFNGDWTNCTNI